jgi:2-hydroxy-6-oxonona-2,4-dienedioate hydrolase
MMHFPLEVNGTVTRVLQAGSGDDTVLFLHGGNSNANRWRESLEPTSLGGRRSLAVDLPGRGFAVENPGPLTVPAFARFVEHFLDVMEIQSVSLVGASLGGHVAATFACANPHRVRHLVLVGPTGIKLWDRDDRIRIWRQHSDYSRSAITETLTTRGLDAPTSDEIEEEFRLRATPGYQRAMDEMAVYMTGDGWEADLIGSQLAAVTAEIPTLVVWGGNDRTFPAREWAFEVHDSLPGSYLAIVEGAGHDADLDRPELFHPLLLGMLDTGLPEATSAETTLKGPS